MTPDSELREVYSAADTPDAHFVKGALEAARIEARVVGDVLQNVVGDLPWVAIAPRVWVHAEDFDRARQVIREHQAQRSDVQPTTGWKCSACGEPNEPAFDFCWNCQTERVTKP